MPSFGPVKRRDLIACLRRLDYNGPYSGGRHEFMYKGNVTWFCRIHTSRI